MSTLARRYKVAISFSSKQLDWVEQLAERLSARFATKNQHGKELILYYPEREDTVLTPAMHKTLERAYGRDSDVVVAVLSRDYYKSLWCNIERHAYNENLIYKDQQHRVLLLRSDDVETFAGDGVKQIDNNLDEIVDLICRKCAGERVGPEPARRPQNLPHESLGTLFKGRDDTVKQLHERLTAKPDLAQAIVQKQAIHGEGGIGKTRLAIEYAWLYAKEYTALLFVQADSPENLHSNLARLCEAKTLNRPEKDVKEQPVQVDAVLRWLQDNPGWLLILDNVDSDPAAHAVKNLQPHFGNGHVLITSRRTNWWGSVQPLKLDVLEPDAAVAYLLERTESNRQKSNSDGVDARALATELDGLAAMLEQAAAFVACRHISFADYLRAWLTRKKDLLEFLDTVTMDYPRSVFVTWDLSFEAVGDDGRELLRILSWLAPDPIPRAMFANEVFEEPLAQLVAYSLVKWQADQHTFKVHRLIQEVTRLKMTDAERKETLGLALKVVNVYIPEEPAPNDVRSWSLWNVARPHVGNVIAYAEQAPDVYPPTRLMNELALHLSARVLYREAESLYRRALAIDETRSGPEHPNVARDLNNLAQLLQDTNRPAQAEPLMRRVVTILKESHGEDNATVATALNNLAALLQATNRPAEAEPLARRALSIDEKCLGPEHPNVARGLNNLAQLLKASNQLAEAEPLMARVVTIFEKSFGDNHPNVSTALNNLAGLLQATNRLAKAEPLMRRALAIDEQTFGPEHPAVAADLNNLATLLQATNRLAEAEPLMRRALAIDEQSFGPEHPRVAIHLSNLAQLLYSTNQLGEAEPLMRRALAIDEQSFGPEHPAVAIDLNNLAQLLQVTNRLAEAESLMRRALAIDETSFGPEHPKVAIRLNNLAGLLLATNRLAEAEPLTRCHVVIFRKFNEATGHEHPHWQAALGNYLGLLEALGLSEAAIAAKVREVVGDES